jgi:hypothetical protein
MNDLIPCLGSISFVLIVFGFFAFLRYMRHREILTLAEKGLVYPERRNGKDTLRWGIVITAIGLALIVGIAPVAWGNFWPLLLIGLLPAFFGLGLVLIYVLTREPKEKEEEDVQVEEADTPEA